MTTVAAIAHRAIEGWAVDKRVSIPAIIAILSAIVTASLYVSELRSDVRANAKEIEVQKHEMEEHKAFTKAIPVISERVGRLEATVAASTVRQEQNLEEIKALIIKSVRPVSPVRRP